MLTDTVSQEWHYLNCGEQHKKGNESEQEKLGVVDYIEARNIM